MIKLQRPRQHEQEIIAMLRAVESDCDFLRFVHRFSGTTFFAHAFGDISERGALAKTPLVEITRSTQSGRLHIALTDAGVKALEFLT